MNKEIEKMALRMVECIVRQSATNMPPGWPPQCSTFLHQPKRPIQSRRKR